MLRVRLGRELFLAKSRWIRPIAVLVAQTPWTRSPRRFISSEPEKVFFSLEEYEREAILSTPKSSGIESSSSSEPTKKVQGAVAKYVSKVASEWGDDTIVLAQVGSFYEFYGDQAIKHAESLGLRFTNRKVNADVMAGFPVHQLDKFCKQLVVDMGYRVVILDQVEDIRTNSKYKSEEEKRPISRILSPGTLVAESYANTRASNFLLAIYLSSSLLEKKVNTSSEIGLAWLDLTIGSVFYQTSTVDNLMIDIARIKPKEIILDSAIRKFQLESGQWYPDFVDLKEQHISYRLFPTRSQIDAYTTMFTEHKDTISFAIDRMDDKIVKCLGALLKYVQEHVPGSKFRLKRPVEEQASTLMTIDPQTLHSLELFETKELGSIRGSLISIIDETLTDGGARMLYSWLSAPLLSVTEINKRLDYVEYFLNNIRLMHNLQSFLHDIEDIERHLQALSIPRFDARILFTMCKTIIRVNEIVELLERQPNLDIVDESLKNLKIALKQPFKRAKKFLKSINESFFTPGDHSGINRSMVSSTATIGLERLYMELEKNQAFSKDLLKTLRDDHKDCQVDIDLKDSPQYKFVVSIKTKKPENIKIDGIKIVQRKNVYLYQYIPWIQLGTEKEHILSKIKLEEQAIFERFRKSIYDSFTELREIATIISLLDVTTALATLARNCNLVRPVLDMSNKFAITKGRHLTVEQGLLKLGKYFVANDCHLNGKFANTWMITGPNMGGKSTFIRQVALISILAQIGSFVPAERAHIGIVDKIFSRVGSADNLYRGRSTFMVEMLETSNILKNATRNSLAILDEVGRGTSSKNGIAIAYATLAHLSEINTCRTLFATHFGAELYHLLELYGKKDMVNYYYSDIDIDNMKQLSSFQGIFSFIHTLRPGICTSSHGLRIAAMAGFPSTALQDADKVLDNILTPAEKTGKVICTESPNK